MSENALNQDISSGRRRPAAVSLSEDVTMTEEATEFTLPRTGAYAVVLLPASRP